jgi:hypothetical protein
VAIAEEEDSVEVERAEVNFVNQFRPEFTKKAYS